MIRARADRWRHSRLGVAITAAGIAAVVCLIGWPRPTLYALGAVAGAIVLLVGLRLLATGRGQTDRPPCAGCAGCGGPDCAELPTAVPPCSRCGHAADEHSVYGCLDECGCPECPDASGPDPETARTNPDEPETQPADQAGHNPDDLRTRIADAIRHALKTRTLPPLTLYGHQAFPGIDLTEYDLADVALTVVQPGLTQIEKERDLYGHDADRLRGDWIRMRARAENAEAERGRLTEELVGARATITHMSKAMSWTSGHDRQGLDHLDEAQYEAGARYSAVKQAQQWATRARDAEATIARVREVLPFAEKVVTTSGPGPASAATAITDRLRTALTPPADQPDGSVQ